MKHLGNGLFLCALTLAPFLAACGGGGSPSAPGPSAGSRYSVTDLGTFGGPWAEPLGINDRGQVVGYYFGVAEGDFRAFLWDNGVMTDLGTLGGDSAAAFAINSEGLAVGWAIDNSGIHRQRPFMWSAGAMTDPGPLAGRSLGYGYANGVNDKGQVVGWQDGGSNGIWAGFLYDNGVMTTLGTFGGICSFAYGINNRGQIVGSAENAGGRPRPFLYDNGVMTDLATPGRTAGEAFAINNNGVVAGGIGFSYVEQQPYTPCLWDNGIMIDLGAVPWTSRSPARSTVGKRPYRGLGQSIAGRMRTPISWPGVAVGLNDHGQVVGNLFSTTGQGDWIEPFLYDRRDGSMKKINDLLPEGWVLFTPSAINNRGQIVGQGYVPSGHILLLTPQ